MYRHWIRWPLPRRDTLWLVLVCALLLGWWLDRRGLIHQRQMYEWRLEVLAERYRDGRGGTTLHERGFVLDRERSRPPAYLVYWK